MISCTRVLFDAIASQTSEGICLANREGNILLANSRLGEITGYREAQLLTRKIYDLTPAAHRMRIDRAVATGNLDFFDIDLIGSSDEIRNAQISLKPLRLDDKEYLVALFRHLPEIPISASTQLTPGSHLGAILEAADSVAFITTTVAGGKSRFTDFSPGAELMFGYRRDNLLGQSIAAIRLAAGKDPFPDIDAALKDPREGYAGEMELRRKSGDTFPAMVKIHALYDDDGYIYGMLTVVLDISIQKTAQIELRNQGALLASIFRAAPVGIGLLKNRILQRVNDQVCQISGYTADELLGRDSRMFYPSDADYEYVGEEKYRQIKQFGTGTVETQWQNKNGAIVDVLLSSTPINPTDLSLGVTFSVLDITSKKKAERELIDMHERFRVFMDNIPGCAFIKDTEGRPLYMNKFMLEKVGSKEWIGKRSAEFLAPEEAARVETEDEEVQRRGFKQLVEEIQLINGDRHWFNTLKFTITRADRPTLLGGISLDVTKQRQADEQRAELEAQMRHAQKLESLGVLAGGIAHDFNNLLVGILGNADLALYDLPADSPAREAIESLSITTKRAAELTRQLLAYSGKGRFEIKRIDLPAMIREISNLIDVSISKKVTIAYDFDESTPVIEADASQLRQVIMNLITNASEAMEERGGVITIVTGAIECIKAQVNGTYFQESVKNGPCAFIDVSDTGVGMDKTTIGTIFDPFFSTKFAGRGLGLAAILGIVRGHNGAIKVDSEPGRGTTFRILLPAAPACEISLPVAPEFDERAALGPATILLVDDEEIVRSVGAKILTRFGVTVDEVNDGIEAVEIFKRNPGKYDCVILDLMMPRMDGEECFNALREIDEEVTVILSSGYSTLDIAARFEGKRVAGFIEKPYRLSHFVATVREVLAKLRSASP